MYRSGATGQPIRTTPRGELQPAPVTQHLKLMPDLGADVVVVGIEGGQRSLVGIDVVQFELGLSPKIRGGLDRLHNGQQPAARIQTCVTQEQRCLPSVQILALGHMHPARDQGGCARSAAPGRSECCTMLCRAPVCHHATAQTNS